jgi:hypothetical protein
VASGLLEPAETLFLAWSTGWELLIGPAELAYEVAVSHKVVSHLDQRDGGQVAA